MASRPGTKLTVYHVTAPTCWWSWGYQATLNRIRLVYGDQVDVHLFTGCVYEDFDSWLRNYGMNWDDYLNWQQESAKIMGVPLGVIARPEQMPRTVMPASYAVVAARLQGMAKGDRFYRALLRRFNVEGQNVTREGILLDAAREAGLDVVAFKKAYADTRARRADLDKEKEHLPNLPLGFFNVAVSDNRGRSVLIDHAFEPRVVEGAIEYLSDGVLAKNDVTDIAAYLRANGLAPLVEIARVMGFALLEATSRLADLERLKKIEKLVLAGAPHWQATDARVLY